MHQNRGRKSGFDEDDPYTDVDISSLPNWWRELIDEFDQHGMPPYRPPKFADGVIVPPVVETLENELNVKIRVRARNPSVGDSWGVYVDDTIVGQIDRHRDGNGYTVYELTANEFRDLVHDQT